MTAFQVLDHQHAFTSITKCPAIMWSPFAIFSTSFSRGSLGKLAGKVASGGDRGKLKFFVWLQKWSWNPEEFSSILEPHRGERKPFSRFTSWPRRLFYWCNWECQDYGLCSVTEIAVPTTCTWLYLGNHQRQSSTWRLPLNILEHLPHCYWDFSMEFYRGKKWK